MPDTTSLSFSQDELEMLVDALEVDLEGYAEAAKEARLSNNREDIVTFSEAATRIQMLIEKLREHVEE
jgi:molecular chaperone DnaK (HSP70)